MTHLTLACTVMLLLQGVEPPDNPWKAKAPDLIAKATSKPTIENLRGAFDAAWRADDWQAGLALAKLTRTEHADPGDLRGLVVRSLWRAGRIVEAEELAAGMEAETSDATALRTLIGMHLSRGDRASTEPLGRRLRSMSELCAEDYAAIAAVEWAHDRMDNVPRLLRKVQSLSDASHGYPHAYLLESTEGLPEFLEHVGPRPLNLIAQHGEAPMPPLALINLPSCDVYINGRGPYRMVVDTGGSIMISIDRAVAEETGLKSLATASIRGVSGKQDSGQAIIDELTLGTIRCERVLARIFDVRSAVANMADGIIGTGVFARGRMTLDFAGGRLVVAKSDAAPAPGTAVAVRLVSDAKIMVPVEVEKTVAIALLDTGADVVAISPSFLRRHCPDQEVAEVVAPGGLGVGEGEQVRLAFARGVEARFGGRTFEKYAGLALSILDDTLSPILGMQTDLLIGMTTFREMRTCTVDYEHCRMWIEWLPEEDASQEVAR